MSWPTVLSRLKQAGAVAGMVLFLGAGTLFLIYIAYLVSFPPTLHCSGNTTVQVSQADMEASESSTQYQFEGIAQKYYPQLDPNVIDLAAAEIAQRNPGNQWRQDRMVVIPTACGDNKIR